MAGAEIFDVSDKHPHRSLRNPDLSSWTVTVEEVLAQFGWALLLLCSALYLLVKFLKRRPEGGSEEPAPEPEGRAEALEAARRRMQEELDSRAAQYREKMRQQEEQKRRQKIDSWENMQTGRSCRETRSSQASEDTGSSSVPKPKKDKKSLRSAGSYLTDYSPLSSQGGGSCSWRPGRRGPSSGG